MKKILIILVLVFTLFGCERNYIKDFKIDGIGLEDSLLDFFSKDEIQTQIEKNINKYVDQGLDKEFVEVDFLPKGSTYDALSFFIKPDDPKYIIYSLSGKIYYEENIDQCYEKLNEIVNEFTSMFKDAEMIEGDYKHPSDITGKSTFKNVDFLLDSGERVDVSCYDFDRSMQTDDENPDGINIFIDSVEFMEWFG
tara:strand:- start:414 stop:998 length:585 start_codon:yes stop_codon:yes gene_type:complete